MPSEIEIEGGAYFPGGMPGGAKAVPVQAEKPEKKPEPGSIEALPAELQPYAVEMQGWVNANMHSLKTFLEYPEAEFTIHYGQGFSFQPDYDIITLDVFSYRESRDAGETPEQAIFHGTMHELAHLKTMWERDSAGRANYKQHQLYCRRRALRGVEKDSAVGNLGTAYHHFFNIIEDCVVNHLVFDTQHFDRYGSEQARSNDAHVRMGYLEDFFAIYEEVPMGEGDFIKDPDPKSLKGYINVGEGKGNLKKKDRTDYVAGFDWKDTTCKTHAGQFITFLMKEQNSYLEMSDVYDPERNPTGIHRLSEPAMMALTRPLPEAYQYLLRAIIDKYKSQPDKLKEFLKFMSDRESIVYYKTDENGRTVEDRTEDFFTVFPRDCIIAGGTNVSIQSAFDEFSARIEALGDPGDLNIPDMTERTFVSLFDQLKRKDTGSPTLTLPLLYNLSSRCRVYRQALEPIFTMLTILDGSFDKELKRGGRPPSPPPPPGGEPPKPPKEKEPPRQFQKGDEVVNNDPSSPYFKRKGQIIDVERSGGKVVSVEVEYYEAASGGAIQMTASATPRFESSTITEIIINPNEKTSKDGQGKGKSKLLMAAQKGGGGPGGPPQEQEMDSEEDEEEKKSKQKGSGEAKEKIDNQDIKDALDDIDAKMSEIQSMLNKDNRKANQKELNDQKNSPDYHKKAEQRSADEKLITDALREKLKSKAKAGETEISGEERKQLEESLKEYHEILNKYRDSINKMAEDWEKIVRNITSQVVIMREKYFPKSGKVDVQRLARILPEIEAGKSYDEALIYARFVEKMKTEIMPRALRVCFIVDNSGSMGGSPMEQVRICVLLLRESLRSLRNQFVEQMKPIFGPDGFDFFCDFEIHMFGSVQETVKSFQEENISFLEPVKGKPTKFPEQNIHEEDVRTLLAYTGMNGGGGGTYLKAAMDDVARIRQDATTQRMINSGYVTELVFVISDGQLSDGDIKESRDVRSLLKKDVSPMQFIALGIGDGGTAKAAKDQLALVFGAKNSYEATPLEKMVAMFGEILKTAIKAQVEDKIIEKLKAAAQK